MHAETTRRALIAGAGLTTIVLAVPVMAVTSSQTPFRIAEARYRAATARFNSLPANLETTTPAGFDREERAYLATVEAVDSAPCETWEEFGAAFRIACDDGASLPTEPLIMKLLADAQRLSAKGGVA